MGYSRWETAGVAVGLVGIAFGVSEIAFTTLEGGPYIVGLGAAAVIFNLLPLSRSWRQKGRTRAERSSRP